MTIFHFSGAGNNFVVLDGRDADLSPYRTPESIVSLCNQYHTDGLMILGVDRSGRGTQKPCRLHKTEGGDAQQTHEIGLLGASAAEVGADFTMEFYNPDGSGGMMCGNGGRCIAAFADYLGIQPSDGNTFHFLAPDGPHTAELLEKNAEGWTIRLQMKDVSGVTPVLGGYFLDTGTRHYVRFVDDVETIDIETEGPRYRHDPAFAPIGANANFVQRLPDGGIKVRTFEKGVEGETLACGTGITASAIAAWYDAHRISPLAAPGRKDKIRTPVRARQDDLSVDFLPTGPSTFTDVYLTGPAVLLATYDI